MKKPIIFIFPIVSVFLFASCKKVDTCQCWKSGVESEEINTAYGFPPNTQTLKTWEKYLVEKVGYDSVRCKIE